MSDDKKLGPMDPIIEEMANSNGTIVLILDKDGNVRIRHWGIDKYKQSYLNQCLTAYLNSSLTMGDTNGK